MGAAAVGTANRLAGADIGLVVGAGSGLIGQTSNIWPDIRLGDMIVAIQGKRLSGEVAEIHNTLLTVRPGPLTLRFQRDDLEWEASAEVGPYPLRTTLALWGRVATAALLLLTGFVAFVTRPGDRVAWIFLTFCTAFGFHLLIYMALLHAPPHAIVLELFGLYLTTATGLHLFTLFPRRLFLSRAWALLFYLPPLVAGLIISVIYLFPSDSDYPLMLALSMGSRIFSALGGLGAVILTGVQYRQSHKALDTVASARSRALLVAVLVGLALPSILVLIPAFDRLPFSWALSSIFVLGFVVITGYAIVRHNALDLDRFTAAILGYTVTSLVLGGLFMILLIGVPALVGQTEFFSSTIATAAVTAALFLLFQPLYRRIRARIDRVFQREVIDEATTLRLLRELADSVRSAELSKTFQVGMDTARSLHAERAELWTRSPDEATLVRTFLDDGGPHGSQSPQSPPPINADGALIQALAEGSGGVDHLADKALDSAAQEELWSRDLALAAPILSEDQVHGFVALARKKNGTAYVKRERAFLENIASHLGIAVERQWDQSERLGPYRILERLGTGGMAEVFLAEKQGPGGFELQLAIKRILPHLSQDPSYVTMFLDEARIAASLHHPNIVRIHDIEKIEGVYLLVMELVDGPPLSTLILASIEQRRPLPPTLATAVAVAILKGLQHAHNQTDRQGQPLGLVHRDIKPANILTSRQGEIKLADFGIARAEFKLYQTEVGRAQGTLPYMAPEQSPGHRIERHADLFSAATVIYEVLTGEQAFAKGFASSSLVPPSRWVTDLPPAVDTFMQRALAKEPKDRFESADAMRQAFLDSIAPTSAASEEEVALVIESLVPPVPPDS